MNWNSTDIKPKDNSWVLIQSSLKNTQKYEVCIYENGVWVIPSNKLFMDKISYVVMLKESDIAKWCYIENQSANTFNSKNFHSEQPYEQCSFCGNENVTIECDGVWCTECSTRESKKV